MDSITITRIDKSTDRVAVTVEYSIDGVVSSESFRASTVDSAEREARRRYRQRVAMASEDDTTPLDVPLTANTTVEKTPEDEARDSFLGLLRTYQDTISRFRFGDGVTTREDVDAALADLKAAYRAEYSRYLIEVF